MSVRPLVDSEGNLIIRGALVGSMVFDAEMAVILLLKLEQFEKLLPVNDPPPDWEPLMRGAADPHPDAKDAGLPESHETEPSVQMLQIAIPVHEARKLGWTLTQIANQMLGPTKEPKN